jgi:hypothetical protein
VHIGGLGVDVEHLRDHARDRELRQRSLASRRAHALAQLVVAKEPVERGGERANVADGHGDPGNAVEVGVRDARGQVRRDRRRTGRVRLDLHEPERLAGRHARQAEHVGGAVVRRQLVVVLRLHPRDPLSDAVRPCGLAQLAFERAAADHHEVGIDLGHGAHEHVDALVVDEPADEQHDRPAAVLGADLLGAG